MIALSDSGYPAGTIVVAAGIQPRYYEFQLSLEGLGAPAGTKLHIERSCDIAQNFNNGVKKMIGDWVWFLGDDHSFSPALLLHFLKRDVDVVVPITPCKGPPYAPCIMHGIEGEWRDDMPLYHWDEVSGQGLLPLPQGDFIGQAGMLVKKHVLDRIGYPWFKCGQIDPGRLQEDLTFCRELQQRGYTVHVDQDVIFDHHVPMRITARRVNGQWIPGVGSGAGTDLVLMPYSATRKNGNADTHDFNSDCDTRQNQPVQAAGSEPLSSAEAL
jgi:hypothetical protein